MATPLALLSLLDPDKVSVASFRDLVSQLTSSCCLKGIGRAIARRLARDGYAIALNDVPRNKEALSETASIIRDQYKRRGIELAGDVSKEDDVKRMIDEVVDRLGALDVVVANAGVAILQPFLECK